MQFHIPNAGMFLFKHIFYPYMFPTWKYPPNVLEHEEIDFPDIVKPEGELLFRNTRAQILLAPPGLGYGFAHAEFG